MSLKILIVDDENFILDLISRTLMLRRFEILTARDGQKALEIAEQLLPDLILLDYKLPGMDGLEICRKIKENPMTQNIPVVLLTGCLGEEFMEESLAVGASDFFTKPFSPTQLLSKIESILNIVTRPPEK